MALGQSKLIPFIATSALVLVAIHLVNLVFAMQLNLFGILPRETSGLIGIVSHPFLHADWSHLLNNILSFSLFSALVWQFKPNRIAILLPLAAILPGILVWLFARTSIHVGLSGIVYFLWAYVVLYGLTRRSIKSVLISIVVIVLYGSMAWGVLPIKQGMSFETHLFGMLMGAITGYLFAKKDSPSNKSMRDKIDQAL